MSSPPVNSSKKPIRELSSITNQLLLSKTLNALNNNSSGVAPSPSICSIKENIPNDTNLLGQQKALNLRLAAALKPVDRDNVAALLQFYQNLNQQNHLPSNASNQFSIENSSSVQQSSVSKTHSKKPTSMTYLCRFHQRNRLIEISSNNEFYNQQNGISHEHLKQLIVQEFQLQKNCPLIIQIWNDQYQDYIDIESFKKIPFDGRLQVLIEKPIPSTNQSPISSNAIAGIPRSITPIPLATIPNDDELLSKSSSEEPVSTVSPMENLTSHLMYDLLPKPTDGIPIPRFPPHIAAFLNGNGDANQLNALVQALYQEIVKYELYPNADELRSIVSRLVDRHPNSLPVIGSVELLVRKLYYKFCNERKKYPVELKRRQPNKRKRLTREDDPTSNAIGLTQVNSHGKVNSSFNDFDRLMHLWTNPSGNNTSQSQGENDGSTSPAHSPSNSSSNASTPDRKVSIKSEKFSVLNLSMPMNGND